MDRDVAIIGISGKFPMANNLDELFNNLNEGVDCVKPISKERVSQTTLPENRDYRSCGYLEDIDKFDYSFFDISLAEAKAMSPEQRLILEVTHAAIENSGYSPSSLRGTNTAIYVSLSNSEYYQHADEFAPTLITGNSPEFFAAKIAKHFNLKGNALAIESSCSSSLVALHTACNELIVGDADKAIIAGVNLVLFPFKIKESGLDLDSPDGKSKAFSAQANGMSYGEIAVSVILKPLKKAIRDKDNIHAVIKGTAVNNNGNDSSSVTAPDSKTQSDVLKKAWKKAGINPVDLSYIEAHGSGTQLGDSLEFEGINMAFEAFTSEKHICPISTIKSNIGHSRSVAGLAGILRTVLSLKYKTLFKTLHFEEPSTIIDFKNAAVFVNDTSRYWDIEDHKKRTAGVTSIGVSGTNCHIVLQELEVEKENEKIVSGSEYFHIPISGKTDTALYQNLINLQNYLSNNREDAIHDMSYTLSKGRDHYEKRISYVVKSTNELIEKIKKDTKNYKSKSSIEKGKLIFIFSESNGLTNSIISNFKQYKVFRDCWTACEQVAKLNTSKLKDFAFQYSFYSLLSSINILTEYFLPLGLGSIIYQVTEGSLTLEKGLSQANKFVSQSISKKEERVEKLVKRFSSEGSASFLDIAAGGALSENLNKYDQLDASAYFIGIKDIDNSKNPLLNIIHLLYLRNFQFHEKYTEVFNLNGRKIELPSYQFDKTRCWIRDKPKELNDSNENNSAEKSILKEVKFSNTEFKIAEIFAEILNINQLSVRDNFFELGGDSLKATQVIMKLNTYYQVSINFEDMFDFPTVHELATLLNDKVNTEKKVILIWETVLETDNLKIQDDFFELGGHSLMATTMITLIQKEFNINLNFEDVFQKPTIKELSALIDKKLKENTSSPKGVITKAPIQDYYKLTYSQKRMWFLNHFDDGNSAYNNVIGVCMEGSLNYDVFNKALYKMLQQQESLRTIFKAVDEEPRQFILNDDSLKISIELIDFENKEHVDELIDQVFEDEYNYSFDLSQFPLFRIRLIKITNDKHVCVLNQHHIISDGWSLPIFVNTFYNFYEHILNNKELKTHPFELQIKDYAEWQHKPEFQNIIFKQESYWLNKFNTTIPKINLPNDYPRPAVQSFEGDRVYFRIDHEESVELKKIAKESGATLFMVLLSIYNVFLAKLSNSEDIIVGSPVAGRRFDGLQLLIGLFVNTIVLRNHPKSDLLFSEFLIDVKKNVLEAFNNQDYPYEELVLKLLKDRDSSRNPIFDTLFLLQNNKKAESEFGSIKTSRYTSTSKTSQFDLLLEAIEVDNRIEFELSYSTSLFEEKTIHRFVSYFKNIVSAVTAHNNLKISEIEIVSKTEKTQLLENFNETYQDYSLYTNVVALFEEQAEKNPDNIAIAYRGKSYTYGQLKKESDQIAYYLLNEKGAQPGDFVGILLEHEACLISSILGVLKIGGTYIPLNLKYPKERIANVIKGSQMKILITRSSFKSMLTNTTVELIDLNAELETIKNQKHHDIKRDLYKKGTIAYIIYTSGTTGNPKGVMVENKSLANYIVWAAANYIKGEKATFPLFTSISFDLTITSIFTPLITGNKIIIYDEDSLIENIFLDPEVDIIKLTPSHLKMINNDESYLSISNKTVKKIIVGGEELETKTAQDIYNKFNGNVEIYNEYGPTEATVGCMVYKFEPNDDKATVPIGVPISNTQIYILDKNLKPVPLGVAGELYVSGNQIAKGYLFNENLTSEKFIDNPFIEGKVMYKTGDLALMLNNGNITYKGRIDNQIKIRGFRIEISEIVTKLLDKPEIKDAIVIAKGKGEGKYLMAYYVSDKPIEIEELKSFLAAQLPEYMIPTNYMHLKKLPISLNGKLDLTALPEANIQADDSHIEASGEIEEMLVEIWAEILKLNKKQISVTRSFFELGGNSIRVIHLINTIKKRKSVKITLREMFKNATIQKLSKLIEKNRNIVENTILKVEKRDYYPASSAQERIFYQQFAKEKGLMFNITVALKLKDKKDLNRLNQSFQQLIERHESLRTSFKLTDEGVVQKINKSVKFEFITINNTDNQSLENVLTGFVKPFDLSEQSLMRCGILSDKNNGDVLLIDIHHIICDGISMNILISDFIAYYNDNVLKPLPYKYVDYTNWQRNTDENLKKQKQFWFKQLSGQLPRLDLPVIKDRSQVETHLASSKSFELKGETFNAIKHLARNASVSDFMFLLSINYLLLHKISKSKDIIIGSDVVGRTQPELKDIVGTFVNILPLRVSVNSEDTYLEFLQHVKNCVLQSVENQDFQFDEMVTMLNQNDIIERNPIVDIHFSLHNVIEESQELEKLNIEILNLEKKDVVSEYELKIEAFEDNNLFRVEFTYNKALYSDEIIESMIMYFNRILNSVLNNNSIQLQNIELESKTSEVTFL